VVLRALAGVARAGATEVSTDAMVQFATGFSASLSMDKAADELACQVEAALGGPSALGGGFLFSTAATGRTGTEIGRVLGERWPEATLLGTTFEGVLAEGRAWRDVPAVGLMAWAAGPEEPIPFFYAPGELDVAHLAAELLEASATEQVGADDLLLLFPDSLASNGIENQVEELARALGHPSIAGSAASGLVGLGCQSWFEGEEQEASTAGLLIPGGAHRRAAPPPGFRVRCAGATRFASPWLEVSACRERWVDGLDGEPPLDWVRRQLGLGPGSPIEPHLGRLLVRMRHPAVDGARPSTDLAPEEASGGDPSDFVERYVIGVDDRRGAISLQGEFERGGHLALALPDPDLAREALRSALLALTLGSVVMHFGSRARDESLYGDADLEPAVVAHGAGGRATLGTLAPFQLGPDSLGPGRMLVHSTVLASLGEY
jgi:small ligand-binding sensory domain FIST